MLPLSTLLQVVGEEDEEESGPQVSAMLVMAASRMRQPRLLAIESEALRNMIAVQDNQGYEKYIRLDQGLFHALLQRVAPIYESLTLRPAVSAAKKARSNRRCLDTKEALFLTLRHLAAGSNYGDLAVIAGVSFSTTVRVLDRMAACLLEALRRWKKARICAPTEHECIELSKQVVRYLRSAIGFIAFADGIVFMLCVLLTLCRSNQHSGGRE